jgi:lipopolysaccharide transport system ATP-binding protein
MSNTVIKVENLGKQYRLGQVGTGTISHDLNRFWYRIRGLEDPYLKIGDVNDRSKKGDSDWVWALKNINFEVKQGETLGIIGKNGAGKSTLLKMLSQITAPSLGEIKIKGRIAALLEVGTGFHPELTGRENIFLNGAILGMTKQEIKSKLDEIIFFSGVEKYLDTPVKRYSSGMIVRLGFAVAAHLEPEILIVDEVLAVGDAEFQKKCLGKMKDVSGEGRTVLFVSHNMAAVKTLCSRGLVLEHGQVKYDGEVERAVAHYLGGNVEGMNRKVFDEGYDKPVFQLHEINVYNKGEAKNDALAENEAIVLETQLTIKSETPERYHITYHLFNEMGEALFSFSHAYTTDLKKGLNNVRCIFPESFFQSGQYFLSLFIVEDKREAIFIERDILTFTIVESGREIGVYMGREPGYIKPTFKWENIVNDDKYNKTVFTSTGGI